MMLEPTNEEFGIMDSILLSDVLGNNIFI